jgi:cell division protein FtsB
VRIGTGAGVRWDRVGRVAMLCVLVALTYLYLSAGIHMLSTWRQSHRDGAAVAALEREHVLLKSQQETLSKPSSLEEEARQLGMMKRGEQPYAISGLPKN